MRVQLDLWTYVVILIRLRAGCWLGCLEIQGRLVVLLVIRGAGRGREWRNQTVDRVRRPNDFCRMQKAIKVIGDSVHFRRALTPMHARVPSHAIVAFASRCCRRRYRPRYVKTIFVIRSRSDRELRRLVQIWLCSPLRWRAGDMLRRGAVRSPIDIPTM